MNAFIVAHRDRFGVQPLCRVLLTAPSRYYAAHSRPPSARAVPDERPKKEIARIYQDNSHCYAARTIYHQLRRENLPVSAAPSSGVSRASPGWSAAQRGVIRCAETAVADVFAGAMGMAAPE
ncbi:hypothetical protein ABZU32_40510 [Sphaerisporangium sp. NPDC005288]|uniref:hypothetical protein n=1 Tax=Sphaerisporangium sp. NPDC005288 TaxID=3155114 RepID=UPI0033BDBC45